MEEINLDLLSGKIVVAVEYENLYHQSVVVKFDDGTKLWVINDFVHGCVEAIARTPKNGDA